MRSQSLRRESNVAMLCRMAGHLLVVLLLVMFVVTVGPAQKASLGDRPVADRQIAVADGVLTKTCQVVRAALMQDDPTDFPVPIALAVAYSPQQTIGNCFIPQPFLWAAILDVLPPVRGPPVV